MHIQTLKYHWVWLIILLALSSACQKDDFNKPRVDVYAHSGMSLYEERSIYPSNSFEAIEYSIDVLSAEGIEIDIQFTKDSVPVLFHDAFITKSPNFNGCVGGYTWDILKELKYDYSNYSIVTLKKVLDFAINRGVKVYLDIKEFNHCSGISFPDDAVSSQLDSILINYTEKEKDLIVVGSFNIELLKKINLLNKCIETKHINEGILIAQEHDFNYILFPFQVLNQENGEKLKFTPFRWGVYGGKANGEIKKTIGFEPSFMISDNFVFTQKITE